MRRFLSRIRVLCSPCGPAAAAPAAAAFNVAPTANQAAARSSFRHLSGQSPASGAAQAVGPLAAVMFIPSAICGCLAYWQYERMRWKEGLIQQRQSVLTSEPVDIYAAEELHDYDKVRVTGVYVDDSSLFVGPRPRSVPGFGVQAGYLLITPLYDQTRKGVVLVNRGWVPASWKEEHAQSSAGPSKPVSKTAPTHEVVGVIQPDEQPNVFMPANKPNEDEFRYISRESLAGALGLPHDTPLVMTISSEASTAQKRTKSPLQEARSLSDDAPPTFPIPKNVHDLVTFTTMPADHMNYTAIWVSLCVILGFMARQAVTKPLRSVRMVDGMTREKWTAQQRGG